MILLKHWILLCFLWMLLSFYSAVETWTCSTFNSTQIVHQGSSTTINCYWKQDCCLKNWSRAFTVVLRSRSSLCAYFYLNQTWSKQLCKNNIRFVWIPETQKISFDLLNVQINHYGAYTCNIDEHIPPPTRCVSTQKTFIHVIASPSVSLSCVKGADGAPTVLCASEGFYPADLTQAWLRDGEYISYLNTSIRTLYEEILNSSHVSWNYSNNPDGSYSIASYLPLSSNTTGEAMYYCWVNHSALSKPITANISSTECTERKTELSGLPVRFMVVGTLFGLLIATALFLECYYRHLIAHHPCSPADTTGTSKPASFSQVSSINNMS